MHIDLRIRVIGEAAFLQFHHFFKNSSYTTLMNRSWNSSSVYFLNVCQNWMTVIMGSLNLPFLYGEISFISGAVILKNSSHLVLTLTFLIQGIQNQWCLWSGKTIIKVRRQMIYCKWWERCTHLFTVPTDFCLRVHYSPCVLYSSLSLITLHCGLRKRCLEWWLSVNLGTCLYSQQYNSFISSEEASWRRPMLWVQGEEKEISLPKSIFIWSCSSRHHSVLYQFAKQIN